MRRIQSHASVIAGSTRSEPGLRMNVRILRDTKEIGGTCIELEAAGKRVALDVGLPLNAGDREHERLLPAVSGCRDRD